ncbi:hypothetical protein QJS10_CPB04g00688 [Acorus calamus]|uniref:Uncharacterized protein n=1 Tax=Acorus calamus TaxID=4465 RepID=A0AAV9EY37_ACOCL|nr:hypothetical protein QJS10_CPB04g00688 [Acorus calamus]
MEAKGFDGEMKWGGIGLSLARQAASAGASRVSILARGAAKLEDARASIHLATGIDVSAFSADVRDFDAVKEAVDAAGPIDVLICNHGVFVPQELERQELKEVRFMVDVNLMGTFNLIKAALPAMKESRPERGPGSIAIMSSQAENKRRPELTKILAGHSSAMQADDVARKALNGIKSGTFIVPCNFDGLMLAIATAGLSPQRSFIMAFAEVFGAGFMRLVGLFFQWTWYGLIEKWHAEQNRSKAS